jgi:hypothetical protein
MFCDAQLRDLVDLLKRRSVYQYHACQFQDFCSYLAVGGIPSRALLERGGLPMTPFTTDQTDRENGVWDKVFVNWEDFGKGFARGNAAVPNPYGPILLRLCAGALANAHDVAVCLRSAGAEGFDRERESLRSVADVDRVFYHSHQDGHRPEALKFKSGLQAEFGTFARSVEISCTFEGGIMPLSDLVDVVVDPYVIEGADLASEVQGKLSSHGLNTTVRVRRGRTEALVYQSLFEAISDHTPPIAELAEIVPHKWLQKWVIRVSEGGDLLRKNYERFGQYLRAGTIAPIRTSRGSGAGQIVAEAPAVVCEHGERPFDTERDADSEYELLQQELDGYRDDSARSDEDGWFYGDADDDRGALDDQDNSVDEEDWS